MLFLNLFLLKYCLNENNTVEAFFAFTANEQGYTLLNLRIEDGKFIANVTETPQAASISGWTLGVIGVTSLMSVLKKKD